MVNPKTVLVVLADVGVGTVEQGARWWQPVVLQDQAELAADLTVAGLALLPPGAADGLDDGVDLVDDVLEDEGDAGWRVLLEDLRQSATVGVENLVSPRWKRVTWLVTPPTTLALATRGDPDGMCSMPT